MADNKQQMADVEALIRELDVETPETAGARASGLFAGGLGATRRRAPTSGAIIPTAEESAMQIYRAGVLQTVRY